MKIWKMAGSLLAVILAGIPVTVSAYAAETIPAGVYIGDVGLDGMSAEEAREAVAQYVDELAERTVALSVDGVTQEVTAGELGFTWGNPEAVEEAVGYEVGGNLIQQYMGYRDLEKNPVHIDLEAAVDAELVSAFVRTNYEGLADGPKDATIVRENGEFVITPGEAGLAVDMESTAAAIGEEILDGDTGVVSVEADVSVQEPEVTAEELATIEDVLGTCTTDFSSSGAARSGNLANGSAKINGRVLMPGETLSGYECMQPFTTANGYYTAAAYENGQVVDSVGGGVCQIATTLYGASLQAELEITQRQNHSMIVTYVQPSMDAAIAGTYKDIKITNNYDTPVYIEAYVSGKRLTFTIYGKETRPENRTVEYVSETLSRTSPGNPTERVDNSLAPGTRRQIQSAHMGIQSRLWKVVYVDGTETEREILHTDTYNSSKAIVLVGPAAPAETTVTETLTGAESTASSETESKVEGIEGGPGVTAAETQAAETAAVVETTATPETVLPESAETEAATAAEIQPETSTAAQAPETPPADTPAVETAAVQ